jgi:intergrase/recombinase
MLLVFKGELSYVAASRYYRKMGYILPKYLRKFAFDKMVELEVPESVADFIEGRVPKRIGAKHYMVLRRQADKFYGKYDEYLKTLRLTVSKNRADT